MADASMVPLTAAGSSFEARVLAARLGAEGIVWEIRGHVDSLYPVGGLEVLVAVADEGRARELLLMDEVASVLDDDQDLGRSERRVLPPWALLLGGFALVAFVAVRILSLT